MSNSIAFPVRRRLSLDAGAAGMWLLLAAVCAVVLPPFAYP